MATILEYLAQWLSEIVERRHGTRAGMIAALVTCGIFFAAALVAYIRLSQ